ncbi:MAG: M20/M25/M40 family metallo-hydrolase [Bacteroidetes bacterium]|nr:M20/M25/M40 family metallo-hydrolase [Rhodothermia bacterium]MCS7154349.1 M20/M25/M40 family metallo-hydrolase [Bacteroidota bacterium]MCX7906614.1 M20/M25/M40 family metallo-hydrolase [Bacteroidota bacterium]MDW8137105.1 M20/M25/M40 family metallo-hydrolase [Bacteroidota bacterium]MDW8285024.1 M20/M25/M40 family metallo-hydrolase [Bacteroidota bacterium]
MRRLFVPLWLLLAPSMLWAQAQSSAPQAAERVDLAVIEKIKDEGLNRSQLMRIASYLTDVIGPRLTGSPQMRLANEWTRDQLAQWGLEARLEPWGEFGRGWSMERFSAHVISPQYFPLIAYPRAWTPGFRRNPVVGEVVYLDANTEEELARYKGQLKGKFVLIRPPFEVRAWFDPPGRRFTDTELLEMANGVRRQPAAQMANLSPEQRRALEAAMEGRELTPEQRRIVEQLRAGGGAFLRRKIEFAQAEGALAVLDHGTKGDGGTVFVQGGGSRNPSDPETIPQIVLAIEHYGRIYRMLQQGVPVKIEMEYRARFHTEDLTAYNTIAEIPGTDPALKDEVVMLGAHLDSWHTGTGATDNASGSAVMMEVMRILKAIGVQPRRTIRLALWTGEEQGLLGSRAYVSRHFARRTEDGRLEVTPAYEKFSVYFNLDNGTGRIRGVYLQGNEAAAPIFREWLRPFHDMGAATLTLNSTGGTDHLAFDAVGLPGFQFIQDPIEYSPRTHHSNMDTFERLQAEDLKQAAVIIASFVYHAAMRDEKIPRKPFGLPLVRTASND